jgi:tetratricopeptide (TPR) repeat protein
MNFSTRILVFGFTVLWIHIGEGQNIPDNTKPMYGEVPKSDELKKTDDEFINESLKQCGSRDSASIVLVENAWSLFYNKLPTRAMIKFNQAWLLNPNNPDCYCGFGVIEGQNGNIDEAIRLLKMGLAIDSTHKLINTNLVFAFMKLFFADTTVKRISYAKQTIACLRNLIRLEPQESSNYAKLAYSYYYANEFENSWRAVHQYEKLSHKTIDEKFLIDLKKVCSDPEK